MSRWLQRKLRALFLWHFRDDLGAAYDAGYIAGIQDAGGPAFEDGYDAGYGKGYGDGLSDGGAPIIIPKEPS